MNIEDDVLSYINEDKKLKELIYGKRVCLCGPAITNKNTGYGDYIDSFDTVCRINWHITGNDSWDDDLICDFGSKTDIMFCGSILKCQWNYILNRKKFESRYNCFKDLKYAYVVDAIFNKIYWDSKIAYRDAKFVCNYSNIPSCSRRMKQLNVDYGVINTHLPDYNESFIRKLTKTKQKFLGMGKSNVFTNSGVHAIESILKHKPKTLFITGMNFGNFGGGGKIKDLYIDKGNSRKYYKCGGNKYSQIQTNKSTITLMKEILNEYKNIELDGVLSRFRKL